MGKHNGKARKTGKSVGSALVNKARRDGKIGAADSYLYTTDTRKDSGIGIQSVIQQNDLEELMSMVRLLNWPSWLGSYLTGYPLVCVG